MRISQFCAGWVIVMKNDVCDTVQSLVNLRSFFTSPVFVSKKNNQIKTKLRKFLPRDQSKQSITYASLDSHYMTLWTTNCPGVLPFPPPFTRRVLRPVPTLPGECWERKASTSVPSTRTTEGIWWTGKHSFIHRKDGLKKEKRKRNWTWWKKSEDCYHWPHRVTARRRSDEQKMKESF